MGYQQKEGDIAIFFAAKKNSENAPDWTGRCLIDGQEKQISLWYKNDTMMTGKVQEPYKKQEGQGQSRPNPRPTPHEQQKQDGYQPQSDDDFEDDIPF